MRGCRGASALGFTLLELLVGIVVSGVVALVAYAATTAGLDTLARVDTHRREAQSRALVRPLVMDALRHVADAGAGTPSIFEISRSSDPARGSTLAFLTRGIHSPLGSSSLWQMTIGASPEGLVVLADPVEDMMQAPVRAVVPGIREVRFRVLATRQDHLWVTNWDSPRQHPYAVKIEMLDSNSRLVDSPLVTALSFERGR